MNTQRQTSGVMRNRFGLPQMRSGDAEVSLPVARQNTAPAPVASEGWKDFPPPRWAEREANPTLWKYEQGVRAAFANIVPVLKEISALQHTQDFTRQAQALAQTKLGFALPEPLLQNAWLGELDMRRCYAHALYETFKRASAASFADIAAEREHAAQAQQFLLDCGFHSVDIAPCADGRLQGLVKYILRLPKAAVHRAPYAGALFDIEESLRRWVEVEHRRYREGVPNTADQPTQYLKIAVYHWSGSDRHQGCAAHGSDQHTAAQAGLERLTMFRAAVQNSFCCGASVATLLIGVNTDNDALRIHVPDGLGATSLYRYVDNEQVYQKVAQTKAPRATVVDALELAIVAQGWGQGEGRPGVGMLRCIATLLENNLKQIDYVAQYHGGGYADIGHSEWFISAGNGFADLPLRNLAYYAHLDTVEEGAADLDVGVKIFKKLNVAHALPVPVVIHARYNAQVPGARDRALARAERLKRAVLERYAELTRQGLICVFTTLQDQQHPENTEFLPWGEAAT